MKETPITVLTPEILAKEWIVTPYVNDEFDIAHYKVTTICDTNTIIFIASDQTLVEHSTMTHNYHLMTQTNNHPVDNNMNIKSNKPLMRKAYGCFFGMGVIITSMCHINDYHNLAIIPIIVCLGSLGLFLNTLD